jgi:hypothetical protein
MNEQNLDYLNRQIKFTGFGEGHEKDLKEKMESGITDFALIHSQEFGQDNATATLHFRKSETMDFYFFNSYDLVVKGNSQTVPVKQIFYIHPKEDHVTFKEGYNLLKGRSIQKEHIPKEGEKYKAWLQLDFKDSDTNSQYKILQFHPNYGFDLEASIRKHPIKELSTIEGTKRLLESLERGNRQLVTYGEPGNEQKVFVEASPKFKSINVYDVFLRRIPANRLQKKPEQAEMQKQVLQDQMVSLPLAKKESLETGSVKKGKEITQKEKRKKIQP